MKNEGTKNVLLGVLIVGLVSMTVAFAALSTQLNINGTAKVTAQTWKVVLDNWALDTTTNGASSANIVTNGGTTDGSTDVVVKPGNSCTECTDITGWEFDFKKPGTKVTYNFNIENQGTIDAKNTALTVGTPKCTDSENNEVTCPITYEVKCGNKLESNTLMSVLNAGDSIACTYMVQYDDAFIPSTGETYTGGNVTGKEINVSGLDVHWTWQQN